MLIDQLPLIDSIAETDELPVERGTTVYKVQVQGLSDVTPTNGSKLPVQSGGVFSALADKAPLESPSLTGTPTAPTPAASDDSTNIATTAFVNDAIEAYVAPVETKTTDIATAGTDVTINSVTLVTFGRVAMLKLTFTKSSSLSGATVVATLNTAPATVASATADRNGAVCYIDTSGNVTINPSSSISANTQITIYSTYIF